MLGVGGALTGYVNVEMMKLMVISDCTMMCGILPTPVACRLLVGPLL